MSKQSDAYIPALRYSWLTSIYDPVVRWTTRESTFKSALLAQADIQPGEKILDLGCGTATLTIAIKVACAEADVVGLDGDPKILEIAAKKAADVGVKISLDQGYSYELPYADNTFHRVVSSLFFHHLTTANKRRTLAEVERVLIPGGEFHLADWGKAQNIIMRGVFFIVQFLDGFETTTANVQGRLPAMIEDAGFQDVRKTAEFATPLGTISILSTKKSGP